MHATPANANHSYVSRIRGTLGIQLFKNSFFMIMNKMLAAGSGFLFWVLAANFYSTGDVGMATALISAAGRSCSSPTWASTTRSSGSSRNTTGAGCSTPA